MRKTDGAFSVGYGHLGDNNLHLNIITPQYCTQVCSYFWLRDFFVYRDQWDWLSKMKLPNSITLRYLRSLSLSLAYFYPKDHNSTFIYLSSKKSAVKVMALIISAWSLHSDAFSSSNPQQKLITVNRRFCSWIHVDWRYGVSWILCFRSNTFCETCPVPRWGPGLTWPRGIFTSTPLLRSSTPS